jgi:hypothetical protein
VIRFLELSDLQLFITRGQKCLAQGDKKLRIRPAKSHHAVSDPEFVIIVIKDLADEIGTFATGSVVQRIVYDEGTMVCISSPALQIEDDIASCLKLKSLPVGSTHPVKTVKGVFSVVDEGGASLDHLIEALAKKANHDLVDEDLPGCDSDSSLASGLRLGSREKITERALDIVVVHGNRRSGTVADFVNSTTFQQGGTNVSVEEADHERKCWLEFTQVLCYYIHGAMSSFSI